MLELYEKIGCFINEAVKSNRKKRREIVRVPGLWKYPSSPQEVHFSRADNNNVKKRRRDADFCFCRAEIADLLVLVLNGRWRMDSAVVTRPVFTLVRSVHLVMLHPDNVRMQVRRDATLQIQ